MATSETNTPTDDTTIAAKNETSETAKTPETSKTSKTAEPITPTVSPKFKKELKLEIEEMLSFALHNGTIIDTTVNPLIESDSVDDLINAHNLLCKNIAPATPKSIRYLQSLYARGNETSFFGKLPVIRNLVFLAMIFLAIFIGTSLSPEVNNVSLSKGILQNEGFSLLMNLLFLFSISGLGIVFYLLKSTSKAIRNGTLNQEDTIYFSALIVLGIISGLILSEIISLYDDGNSLTTFNKSVLALIGGFSSDAIFSILQSLINKIKMIFSANDTLEDTSK